MDRLEAADLARKAERENPAPTPRCENAAVLRERIASAVGPNLSVYGSSPGAQEFADGVCDSIVDAVLEAIALEQVGWFRPDLADGQFEPLSTYRLADKPHEPVFRVGPLGRTDGDIR